MLQIVHCNHFLFQMTSSEAGSALYQRGNNQVGSLKERFIANSNVQLYVTDLPYLDYSGDALVTNLLCSPTHVSCHLNPNK